MKQKILEKVGEMFLKLGYKSVTMDDIAAQMAVSKKTLYKYFSNKQELVEESTRKIHQSYLNEINSITDKNFSPIKENFEVKKMFGEMFKHLADSPLFQLKKYYPDVHGKVIKSEVSTFSKLIKNNLEKGIKKGYYRKNIDTKVCTEFYLALIFSIHEKDIPQNKLLYLEHQALIYHTRAIVTEKGLKELKNQLKFKAT